MLKELQEKLAKAEVLNRSLLDQIGDRKEEESNFSEKQTQIMSNKM